MTRLVRIVFIATALALPLGGCGGIPDIDPTEWLAGDFFNTKKKLPGERKAVFPEGVPGVAQGIPSDLVKGNQPPPGVANAVDPQDAPPPAPRQAGTPRQAAGTPRQAAAPPPEEFNPAPREKAKPKPKPKPKQATAEQPPTSVTVRRPPEQQQQGSPWPDPPQQQPPQRSQPSGGGIQWPDPPPMR